jgi:hypothetical protein
MCADTRRKHTQGTHAGNTRREHTQETHSGNTRKERTQGTHAGNARSRRGTRHVPARPMKGAVIRSDTAGPHSARRSRDARARAHARTRGGTPSPPPHSLAHACTQACKLMRAHAQTNARERTRARTHTPDEVVREPQLPQPPRPASPRPSARRAVNPHHPARRELLLAPPHPPAASFGPRTPGRAGCGGAVAGWTDRDRAGTLRPGAVCWTVVITEATGSVRRPQGRREAGRARSPGTAGSGSSGRPGDGPE